MGVVFICWLLFVLCTTVHYATPDCEPFFFPNLNGTVFTGTENASITLQFEINKCNTTNVNEHVIKEVRVKQLKVSGSVPFCALKINDTVCTAMYHVRCSCPSEKQKMYHFFTNLTRSDNTEWEWELRINGTPFPRKRITFNVTYPAEVKKLALAPPPKIVNNGSRVQITCDVDSGNPTVTARLLDRHGVEMEGSIYSSGQINYTFPAVGCQDAGLIRCEAPGASHNMTAMMLVKCPPSSNTSLLTMDVENCSVKLPIWTHTENITACSMTHVGNCSGLISVSGFLPKLTVTVPLGKVTKEKRGLWTINLTNDAGTGQLDFTIDVQACTADTVTAEDPHGHETESSDTVEISHITAGGACVAVVLVTVLAVFVTCYRRWPEGPNRRNIIGRVDGDVIHPANRELIPQNCRANGEAAAEIENVLFEAAADIPEVVFEAAPEEPQVDGAGAEGVDYSDMSDEEPSQGKQNGQFHTKANQTETESGASALPAGVRYKGENNDEVNGLHATSSREDSNQDDTYVPLSDIIARKRVAQSEHSVKADEESLVAQEGSDGAVYNRLNFNTPRRPIKSPVISRPSCLYTKLSDIKIPPQDKSDQ